MKKFYQLIFGPTFPDPINYNLGFLILRFFVGLALCTIFEKLFPKNGIWGPQDWFVQDVATMGFPFPLLFAWVAVLTEFIGGILLMLGLFTRPAALMNAILTFVAAFIYHQGNILKPGLLAFFFMIMCISILLNGAGKYSLDYLIHRKINIRKYTSIYLFFFISLSLNGQVSLVSSNELQQVVGHWEGTLTYTDYQDDKSTSTLRCKMNAFWKGKKGRLEIGFKEPNGEIIYDKVRLKLLKQGAMVKFDGKKYQVDFFKQDEKLGSWELIMSRLGKDNRRNAAIKYYMNFSKTTLSFTKRVKYEGTPNFFERNKYFFKIVN